MLKITDHNKINYLKSIIETNNNPISYIYFKLFYLKLIITYIISDINKLSLSVSF